ncbi:MAG: hypothetical protein J6B60_02760 [Clostridia bacterium]|nr:hypothetical protein [Clostridia bacterium]
MKKLLILIFILTTFLFLTSCDNNESTDESSSETSKAEETTTVEDTTTVDETSTEIVEETTTIEDTSTVDKETSDESSIVDLAEKVYCNMVFLKHHVPHELYHDMKIIYSDYNDFVTDTGATVDKNVFDGNYIYIIKLSCHATTINACYNFEYSNEGAKVTVEHIDTAADIPMAVFNYFIGIVVPKDLFPEDIENISTAIDITLECVEIIRINPYARPITTEYYNELMDGPGVPEVLEKSKVIYTTFEDVYEASNKGLDIAQYYIEEIFDEYYLVKLSYKSGHRYGWAFKGFSDFVYYNGKITVTANYKETDSPRILQEGEHLVAIPKELFPSDLTDFEPEVVVENNFIYEQE